MFLVLSFYNLRFLTMPRRRWFLKWAKTVQHHKILPWISLLLVKICIVRLNIPFQKMYWSCHWFKLRKLSFFYFFGSFVSHFLVSFLFFSFRLIFSVGAVALNGFRMIERHYFRDKLVKSFDFQFGFCIPGSTNTWDSVYALPPLSDELSKYLLFYPPFVLCWCLMMLVDSEWYDWESIWDQEWLLLLRQRQVDHAQQGLLPSKSNLSSLFAPLLRVATDVHSFPYSILEKIVLKPRRVTKTSLVPRDPKLPSLPRKPRVACL